MVLFVCILGSLFYPNDLNGLFGRQKALAASTCYWHGATSTSWNDLNNWSDISGGGPHCNGGAIPDSVTTVIFDINSDDHFSPTLNVTTTVAGVTTTIDYTGTITLANDAYTLTASAVTLNAGTLAIATQAAEKTKITMTSLTLAGGTFTTGDYGTVNINGNYTQSSGTFTSANAYINITTGDFDYSGGTFTNGGAKPRGIIFKGNSSNITHAFASIGFFTINKAAAGQTLTFLVPVTAKGIEDSLGTLNTNGQLLTLNTDSGTLYLPSQTIDSLFIAANPVYITGSMTVNGNLTIDNGKVLTVQNSSILTLSDTARLIFNNNLSAITSYVTNPGTIVFKDDAATNIPTIAPAVGGGINAKIKVIAATKDVILPGRDYKGRLEINNNSALPRTVTFGSADGQTFNIGGSNNDAVFVSGLYVSTDLAGTLTVDATAHNPTVNLIAQAPTITVGHIGFTGAASKTIKAGTGNTWSLVGNMDLTNGSLDAGTSTFVFNGTSSQTQTLTSAGSSFNNLTVSNTNATGFTFADGATVAGTFRDTTATSKVTFHSTSTYTIANINIVGASGAEANKVTLKSSTGASAALFNVSQTNPTVSYVTVSDSNASGGKAINATDGTNTNGGGNTFWNFVAVVPAAPTIGTATGGNAQATVTFTPPADNGGSPITGYTVTSTPDTHTGTGAGSPIVVGSLTNGTPYTFTVHATNAVGNGPESAASNAVTPSTIPGAPTAVSAVGGNAQATISFTAPDNGGSPITGYTVTSTPDGHIGTGAGSPIVVGSLTNGTPYTFTVHATNANGNGPESAASDPVTPATVPGAPTIGTATGGNAKATITFTPPLDNGGSPITSYTVTSSPGGITASGGSSPITVNGLTNGTSYTFTVHATNAVGDSAESAASNAVTPMTVPGAPTGATAVKGNAKATITFTPPVDNGGSPITGYTVTSNPDGHTGTGAGSPIDVNGLTNGTSYTFTVHATNANGNSAESAPSNTVTPSTVPGAPTIGTATAGNAKATITFTPPVDDGGSAITGYTVTSTPGSFTGTGAVSPIIVGGLTNGTAYTFTVHAINANGNSLESAPSNSVIPVNPVTPAAVPGAPTIGTATAGNAQATVTFTPPADDGGSPITGYTVTSTTSGVSSPIVVGGLTNGATYTFTVHATNAVGDGPESAPSNAVTPSTIPGAPTIGTATSGNAQATTTFTPPADDGGSPITGYTVTSTPGRHTATGGSSPITVNGLTNGTAYTFTVHATNANGNGPESAPSNSVTPICQGSDCQPSPDISMSVSPDHAAIKPGSSGQYSSQVVDSSSADITGTCKISWSTASTGAGTINQSGLFSAGITQGSWPYLIRADATCGDKQTYGLASVVISSQERTLVRAGLDPWGLIFQDGLTNQGHSFLLAGADQFGLLLPVTVDRFQLLDNRIGSSTINPLSQYLTALNINPSKNYGCYISKVIGKVSYNGVSKEVYDSVFIYPERKTTSLNPGGGDTRILAGIGSQYTNYQMNIRPNQATTIYHDQRDQLWRLIYDSSATCIMHNPNAGQLTPNCNFISSGNIGTYDKAFEVKAVFKDQTLSKFYTVNITNEQFKATWISLSPMVGTKLGANNTFQIPPNSGYTFWIGLRDQYGDSNLGPPNAVIEKTSDSIPVDIESSSTIKTRGTQGYYPNALKIYFNIPDNKDPKHQIIGPSPVIYANLDISSKYTFDNPTACLVNPPTICPPYNPDCAAVPPNPPICVGSSCINLPPWVPGIITGLIRAIATLLNNPLISSIFAAAALGLLLLLAAIAALLPTLFRLGSGWLSSFFAKGQDKKHAPGIVYDSASGMPVSNVSVLLFRARDNKLQAISKSGRNGRFALATPPGEEYFVEVKIEGFDLLSAGGSALMKAGLAYGNNYFDGDKFRPSEEKGLFDKAIPLVANAGSVKAAAHLRSLEKIARLLRIINIPIFLFGFAISLLAITQKHTIYNWLILIPYALIIIYSIFKLFVLSGRSYGRVYNTATRGPVDLAVVRAISETNGKLIKTTVSDSKGRFTLALPKGYYNIVVTKANLQQEDIIKSRVKSNFSPTKVKIGLKQILPTAQVNKSSASIRTFGDSDEIIERYNQGITGGRA